jgi:geranylgeranyl reductase family protein
MGGLDCFDLAIVGAGPAGCWAALRMSAAGARVAILDGSHPREKPCGGGVTARALDIVRDAIDLRDVAAVPIGTASFEHGPSRLRMAIAGAAQPLVVASRRQFDAALLAAAMRAGARLIPSRVVEVTLDPGGWIVATRDGSLRAGWLFGADGPTSLVRRRVLRPFERADLSIATGFFVHGTTSDEITVAFDAEPAGYLWSFPRHDHLAMGVCAQADEGSAAALLSTASRWVRQNVPGPVQLVRYSWPIPSLRAATIEREQPAGARWMLLGDAGGMVDPITREGIFFALTSADAAADSLLGSANPAAAYTARVRASIHSELIRAARLKRRFFTPRFAGLMMRALQQSAPIRRVMSDLIAGRQTYHGLRRRLLGTMEVRLIWDTVVSRQS